MKIQIVLFGGLREAVGAGRIDVETAGRAVSDIARDFLRARGLDGQYQVVRCAVNDVLVADDYVPRDGDRLALLTPFAGG
jgi:molybdopterin converting factor small subunit